MLIIENYYISKEYLMISTNHNQGQEYESPNRRLERLENAERERIFGEFFGIIRSLHNNRYPEVLKWLDKIHNFLPSDRYCNSSGSDISTDGTGSLQKNAVVYRTLEI